MSELVVSISFAITTHNETHSLVRLLKHINKHISGVDEIVIVDDYSTDPSTLRILEDAKSIGSVYKRKLNGSYSNQKNYLNSKCTKNYIFQIDADELPTKTLFKTLA